mgnify:CR=1 FL=1
MSTITPETIFVLLPYRFTLFSNAVVVLGFFILVLLPYRFTLFSNTTESAMTAECVLLPYRFTLFSNIYCDGELKLMFYYLIDLHYSQTSNLKLGIKCTHYTMHGKSIRLFYNICIMIVNKIHTNHYQSQQVFRIQKLLSVLSFQC